MAKVNHKSVRFSAKELAEDLPPGLDFKRLKLIGRGPRAIEAAARRKVVSLDPDVAKVFATADAVNDALRGLIEIAKHSTSRRAKSA